MSVGVASKMNVTALLLTAAATNQALWAGETTDPATVELIDAIYQISGADPCVFNACPPKRRVLGGVSDMMMGRLEPAAYDSAIYGEFFGTCRDFMLAYSPAPVVSRVIGTCNSPAVSQLVASATAFRTCTAGEIECMAIACQLDSKPLARAVHAAASIEAALARRAAYVDMELRAAHTQILAYLGGEAGSGVL